MPEDYIAKDCSHCNKEFNWEWIGYKVNGKYFCGREDCEKSIAEEKKREAE
jgi:hypothetical protein